MAADKDTGTAVTGTQALSAAIMVALNILTVVRVEGLLEVCVFLSFGWFRGDF